jgi:hypothetical protein
MPHDNQPLYSTEIIVDMPAIWMLNAQIPRVGQYLSQPGCSCWSTGCGELDIVETLSTGNTRLVSTMHSGAGNAQGAGFSDYFQRPVESYVKIAILMKDNAIDITVLPADFVLTQELSIERVERIAAANDVSPAKVASVRLNN